MGYGKIDYEAMTTPTEPIPVFILSYNRPIYLWCCLDSLYRNTRYPARFILADNASTDPLVRTVIEGFERRGMFDRVYMCSDNRPDRLKWMIRQHRSEIGEYFAFIESDVMISDSVEGWLPTMVRLMEANPKLYMLGSHCVKSDFVDVAAARSIDPDMPQDQFEFLTKPFSPERMEVDASEELIEPHNPPGRLLLFRAAALFVTPIQTDSKMHTGIKQAGYESKISTRVVHRHLTLLNFFDYSDYDGVQRKQFFEELDQNRETL
jgi:hypothetical protein